MTDYTIIRKQHNGIMANFVYADVAQDLERSILRALTTLWHTGLSPHNYNTIEKAAEGAAEIIRSLRDHLDNPPPDLQEKVIAMRGTPEHGYHQDAASDVLAKETEVEACTWTQDEDGDWSTSCNGMWTFYEGGPVENMVRWCPMCGRQLEVKP